MSSLSDPDLEQLSLRIEQAKIKQLSSQLAEAQNQLARLKAERQRALDILVPVLETPSSYTTAIKALVRRAFPELKN